VPTRAHRDALWPDATSILRLCAQPPRDEQRGSRPGQGEALRGDGRAYRVPTRRRRNIGTQRERRGVGR